MEGYETDHGLEEPADQEEVTVEPEETEPEESDQEETETEPEEPDQEGSAEQEDPLQKSSRRMGQMRLFRIRKRGRRKNLQQKKRSRIRKRSAGMIW